jgi:cell division protein FtsZ
MGTGEASGEQRAIVASEEAIVNPLLDDTSLKGARSLLLSITGGRDLTLWEVDEAANRVRQEVDPDANIIVGATFDEALGDRVRVSIVASGMSRSQVQPQPPASQNDGWTPRSSSLSAPARSPNDYRLRLREAIDDTNGQGGAGAGNVYITEGPPQLSPLGHATREGNRAKSQEEQQLEPGQGEARPPSVKDFPPHAQREYWAKTGESAHRSTPPEPPFVYQRQPEAPRSKTSLLRRLKGAALGKRDGSTDAPLPKHSGNRNAAGDNEEQVDLPVFFGRGKR